MQGATKMKYMEMLGFLSQSLNEVEPPEDFSFALMPAYNPEDYNIWVLPKEIVDKFKTRRGYYI